MMMMMMMVMKIKIGELYSFQPSLRRARFCADARSLQVIAKMQELDLRLGGFAMDLQAIREVRHCWLCQASRSWQLTVCLHASCRMKRLIGTL